MADETPTVGITDYELIALEGMRPSAAAERALDAIGIKELLGDVTATRAGHASLLVRGLAEAEGDTVTASDLMAAIATIMAEADDILSLIVVVDTVPRARLILLDAPLGGLILDMTRYGVHQATPLASSTDPLMVMQTLIMGFVDDAQQAPVDFEISRHPVNELDRVATLRHHLGSWTFNGSSVADSAAAWEGVLEVLGASDGERSVQARRAR